MRNITSLLLLGILSVSSAFAAVTLIDANTRNGSFEAGNVSPWQGSLQAVQDAAFASEGSWFGRLIGTQPSPRRIGFQFLPANPTNGRAFVARFDARTGTPGFDAIGVELFAVNTNGSLIGTASGVVTVSNLSTAAWSSYELEFELNDGWNEAGNISLQLLFQRNAPGGTTYTGFLDHVTLQQTDAPRLKITPAGGSQLTLSWRTNATGFVVESSSTAGSTNWSPVTAPLSVQDNRYAVTVGQTNSPQFFRLRR